MASRFKRTIGKFVGVLSALSACMCCAAEAAPRSENKLSKKEIANFQKSRNQLMMSYQPDVDRRLSFFQSDEDKPKRSYKKPSAGDGHVRLNWKRVLLKHARVVEADAPSSYPQSKPAKAKEEKTDYQAPETAGVKVIKTPDDVWHKGYGINSDYEGGGHGRFLIGHVGMDYTDSSEMLVGISVQIESCRYDADDGDIDASGTGFMIGPYFTMMLEEDLFFDGMVKAGRSWGTVDTSDVSEDFKTRRLYAEASLIKTFNKGKWSSNVIGGLNYAQDTKRESVDSDGVRSDQQTAIQTDLRVGHNMSYDLGHFSKRLVSLESSVDLFYPIYEYGAGDWKFASGDLRGDLSLGMKYGDHAHVDIKASGVGSDTESVGVSFRYQKSF